MPRFFVLSAGLFLLALCAGCSRGPADATAPAGNQTRAGAGIPDEFLRLMNAGKNYLEQGDATNALATYAKAADLVPNDLDVHLNLANAHLQAGAPREAIREADAALKLESNSAAAYFLKGSAHLRLSNFEEAVKAFENARKIEPGVTATSFQLGVARMGLNQWEEAIAAFQQGLALDPNRLHTAAHYLLGQALLRAGRQAEAERELQQHQAALGGGGPGTASFERSKYTLARVPFKLDQPEKTGITMQFVDATAEVFGDAADQYAGPVAVIDPNHTGWNSLFMVERGKGFRLLWNTNGKLNSPGTLHPTESGANYSKMLTGDLQNDRFEDIIVLGENRSHLFRFETNGVAADLSAASGISQVQAVDGVLMDLDFTGKLDLVAAGGAFNSLHIYRQFGPLHFTNITSNSGIPGSLQNVRHVEMEDWNRDGTTDLVATRLGEAPLLLEKQRGGPLVPRTLTNWLAGSALCTGDFDNDLRPDLAILDEGKINVCFYGGERKVLTTSGAVLKLAAIDHDNDGWLDLWAFGEKIQAWRNLGLSGFEEQTAQLGLANLPAISELHFADFDNDCDSDLVAALANGGLRYFRNQGGNANAQVKVHLVGNRSNASGLGCKVEIQTGALRLIRTVRSLPVEIGVGKNHTLDSVLVHWFNWPQGSAEVPVDCKEPLLALELTIQEGSCPFLYAWDGQKFRFITDLLGAAPLGLPLAEGQYIEADPEELVWIGTEASFPPRAGSYQIQITEELREVLYLDEAKLVVVDRDPQTEVHSTDKLLPAKPFPPGEIVTLHREHPLRKAETLEGNEVTDVLRTIDGRRVSPPNLRSPQLRGLAEPHGLILDFGPLDATRPLALVLNGWLRFGGGMANIAASHETSFPFPFPVLDAEVAPGRWQRVDVTPGAPAGKTKTIVIDLEGKLDPGTRRLRLSQAFEIHWDRIALMEKQPQPAAKITFISPAEADLHYRGFSAYQNLPADWPLTPEYSQVNANGYWTIVPGGWCTRYGDVIELIAARDEGLALLNSGDELTLRFPVASLPPKPPGSTREFFLYVDGWDKDSDFHVAAGTTVEPLPFHGMNDQKYGKEKRPAFPSDALHRKYNTRWVEGAVLRQARSSME